MSSMPHGKAARKPVHGSPGSKDLYDVLTQGLSCSRTTQGKVAQGSATPQYPFNMSMQM